MCVDSLLSVTRGSLPAALLLAICLCGCSSQPPKDAFKLAASSLEDRQMQSRRFDTLDHAQMLSASAGFLQDLGYALDFSNTDLGVLTASKHLDATNPGHIAAMILLAAVLGGSGPVDRDQRVRVCVVVHDSLEDRGSSVVRVTLNRVILDTQGQVSRAETMNQPELYQAFFSKLSKAAFLEAQEI